jgi:hypothetical protein
MRAVSTIGIAQARTFILGARPAYFQVELTFSVQLANASTWQARAPKHETQMRFIIERSIASST